MPIGYGKWVFMGWYYGPETFARAILSFMNKAPGSSIYLVLDETGVLVTYGDW